VDRKAWIGIVWLTLMIAQGFALVRRRRRAGKVLSHGHPLEDALLLLGSALLLIMTLILMLQWFGAPQRGSAGYFIQLLCLLLAALGITVGANRILRRNGARSVKSPPKRAIGSAKGEFTVPDDFNDPLPKEIEDLFWK
jgi:hypothetical protein